MARTATAQICKIWALFPPNSSSTPSGLAIPRGSAALHFPPRASKPNSLDDSWTFSLHHAGRPTRRKLALQRGSSRLLARSFLLCLSTWSRVTSPHALSIYGKWQHTWATVVILLRPCAIIWRVPFCWRIQRGEKWEERRRVINGCFLQLFHLRLTVPPSLSERDGRPSEQSLSHGPGSSPRPSHATLDLETGKAFGFDRCWLRMLELIPLPLPLLTPTLFKMAAFSCDH